jgi:predicted RNA-binding protein with EMAP domain
MAKTVKQLIQELQEVEDQDQAVIYQYFLAEHFEFDQVEATPEQFEQVADDLEHSALWDDPAQTINDYLFWIVVKDEDN